MKINDINSINNKDINIKSSENIKDVEEVNIFDGIFSEDFDDNGMVFSFDSLPENIQQEIYMDMEAELAKKEEEIKNKLSTAGLGQKFLGLFGAGLKGEEESIKDLKTQLKKAKETNSVKDIEKLYEKIMAKPLDQKEYKKIVSAVNCADNLSAEAKETIRNILIYQIDNLQDTLDTTKDNNGILAKGWGWLKNTMGIGASSNKAQAEIDAIKELIRNCDDEHLASVYKSLTGNDLTVSEIEKFASGESSLYNTKPAESVTKYKQGQKTAVDTIAAIGTSAAVIGSVAAGVVAAPFTGGMSLGASIGYASALTGIGAGTYMAIEVTDGLTEKDGYSFDEVIEDGAMAVLNGAVATMTVGISGIGSSEGSTIAKTLVKKGVNETAAQFVTNEVTAFAASEALGMGKYSINAALNDDVDFNLKDLGKTALVSGSAALAAGGMGTFVSNLTRPALTAGSTQFSQIFGRFLSAGISGGSAGATAAFVGGGTTYLVNSAGEEITFKDFLNASNENVVQGFFTGAGAAVAFEAVMYAAGAPKPQGAVRKEKILSDDKSMRAEVFYDKDGKAVAMDINAKDINQWFNSSSADKTSGMGRIAQGTDATTRIVRLSFNNGDIQNYNYAGNFISQTKDFAINQQYDNNTNELKQLPKGTEADVYNPATEENQIDIIVINPQAMESVDVSVSAGAETSIVNYNNAQGNIQQPQSVNPADIAPALVQTNNPFGQQPVSPTDAPKEINNDDGSVRNIANTELAASGDTEPPKKVIPAEIKDEFLAQATRIYLETKSHIEEVEEITNRMFDGLKGNNGKLTARTKSADSIDKKLERKYEDGKLPQELSGITNEICTNAIGDAYGTRLQLEPVNEEISRDIVSQHGFDFQEFNKELCRCIAAGENLSPEYLRVLDEIKTVQTQATVDRIVEKIQSGEFVITELNNYGDDIASYFTTDQTKQIARAYHTATGKALDVVTHSADKEEGAISVEYNPETGESTIIANVKEKGAIKDSGYTSAQMNVTYTFDNGDSGLGEFQVRGIEVNDFADSEHIPYDIRQGKTTEKDSKYKTIYTIIKTMDEGSYNAYNQYLTQTYQALRMKELGFEVPLPELTGEFKDKAGHIITQENLNKISYESLKKYH